MRQTIVEENPSRLEISAVGSRPVQLLVIRKQAAHDDDWLGRIDCWADGTFTAKMEFGGSHTDLHRKFALEDEAVQWLAGLKPDERERAYWQYRQRVDRIHRENWARERRENPQWYNGDGSHIGINSDGSFRSSYRNTR